MTSVCQNCGEPAAEDARYCHGCGSPLATESHLEVRKVVTILFADVVQFTQLGEANDPETLRRIMSRYFGEMRRVIERHGGTVEKFIGDEVMAVFGVPVVHEDDALRAVRAAREMLEQLERLNGELERTWGVRLAIRVGVNTGEVVAGDPATGHGFVTGDAVNLAKRLEQAAEPGQVLLGKATYPLVRDAISAGPLESFKVKGKRDPVAPWLLDEVDPEAAGVARHHDVPLVGRETELADLLGRFRRAAAAGACELVTVVGSPGVGKSRLVAELTTAVEERARSVTGRCLPYGDGITFWPLVEIVRGLGGEDGLPDIVAAADDADAVVAAVRGAIGAAAARTSDETFWGVRRLIEELARDRPALVVLEDVHWAEPTFLDLVEYLAGWIRGRAVLIVCLARHDLLETRPTWATTPLVPLDPLPPHHAELLLDQRAQGRTLAPQVRRQIAEAAEGNPLFIEQMLAMVEEEGEDVAVPPTIQALLGQRLDRLTREERAMLERAAVAGKEFLVGAVAALSPADEHERVRSVLMSLARKDLVAPAPGAALGDAFRFRHALIRTAAYESMPKELRALFHERYAVWLALAFPHRARELEEIVGYHLEQAYLYREQLGPVGESERAIATRAGELLGRAGGRALAAEDMPAAVKLLDRATRLLDGDHPARLESLHGLAAALWSTGDADRASTLLHEVLAAAKGRGDRRLEWYARLDAASWGDVTSAGGGLGEVAHAAIDVFEDIGDAVGLARAWRRAALVHAREGRYADAESASSRALEHARRARDAREAARAADTLCTALVYGPTDVATAIARCDDLLAGAITNRALRAHVLAALAPLEAMRGRVERARELAADARAVYDELGLPLAVAGLTAYSAMIDLLAGDAAAAESELRRGYALLPPGRHRGHWAAMIAHALAAQGRAQEAAPCAAEAESSIPLDDVRGRVLAAIAVADADPARGDAAARDAVAVAETTDSLNLRADAWLAFARHLLSNVQTDAAADAIATARGLYETKGNALALDHAATWMARAPA